jgi:Pentapeptide repeats (9 copies)
MAHPYTELERTRLWAAVESAIKDLVSNNDLVERTARPYIVGYLCQKLLGERQGVCEGMSVRSETITSDNHDEIEWDESYFKFCDFEEFSESGLVGSDFHTCSFKKIDWYWRLFSGCNFINCSFVDCTFAGTSFPDTRFIDCELVNCKFIQDNLGGECDFSNSWAHGCSIENSPGFRPENSSDIPCVQFWRAVRAAE